MHKQLSLFEEKVKKITKKTNKVAFRIKEYKSLSINEKINLKENDMTFDWLQDYFSIDGILNNIFNNSYYTEALHLKK
jgi:hypothetical protein